MDLLARARTLAACPLFAELAPAVVIRLAERARARTVEPGERITTDGGNVWVVAEGALVVASRGTVAADATASHVRRHGGRARAGNALGLVRVIAPTTPAIEAVAEGDVTLLGLGVDDVHDVLEEDPAALAALVDALARVLLEDST